MNNMGFDEWSAIVGIVVSIIGIVVGTIGAKSLSVANKTKNSINKVSGSTVNQAQNLTVNNGLDSYAVIKLAKDVTQEELKEIVKRIDSDIEKIKKIKDKPPNITYGYGPPTGGKDGDIYIQIK